MSNQERGFVALHLVFIDFDSLLNESVSGLLNSLLQLPNMVLFIVKLAPGLAKNFSGVRVFLRSHVGERCTQ